MGNEAEQRNGTTVVDKWTGFNYEVVDWNYSKFDAYLIDNRGDYSQIARDRLVPIAEYSGVAGNILTGEVSTEGRRQSGVNLALTVQAQISARDCDDEATFRYRIRAAVEAFAEVARECGFEPVPPTLKIQRDGK